MPLHCVFVAHHSIVVAFQQVLRTFDLVVAALGDLILTAEDDVVQTEGLVEVTQNSRISPNQRVALPTHPVVVPLHLVVRPFDDVVALGGVALGLRFAEEVVHFEQTAEVVGLGVGLVEGGFHAVEETALEVLLGSDLDGLGESGVKEEDDYEE